MQYDYDCFKSTVLKETAKRMVGQIRRLNKSGADIDTIISRGSSGCSLASAILALTKGELYHLYIRKPKEEAHGNPNNAGMWGTGNAVIVDDFIRTGDTINSILSAVKEERKRVVGILIGDNYGSHQEVKVYHCGRK